MIVRLQRASNGGVLGKLMPQNNWTFSCERSRQFRLTGLKLD
jgi:hypothetical protein